MNRTAIETDYSAAFAEADETSRAALEAANAFHAVKHDPELRQPAAALYRAASERDRLVWERINALTVKLNS
jgi:hypothetical protein